MLSAAKHLDSPSAILDLWPKLMPLRLPLWSPGSLALFHSHCHTPTMIDPPLISGESPMVRPHTPMYGILTQHNYP